MTSNVLTFPSGGSVDRRIEVIRRDLAGSKFPQFRHVARPGTTTAGLPIVPNLPHSTDCESRGIKGQVLSLTPRAQRVFRASGNHTKACKLSAYRLTSESKRFSGSNVSAEILQFARMEDAPNRIREMRVAAGLSQQALGDLIGTSKMTVSDLERGRMELTLEYMRRLARALSCTPVDILPSDDNPDRLSLEERQLLANYREASETQRAMIERIASPMTEDQPRRSAA